jgi:putative endonuclease
VYYVYILKSLKDKGLYIGCTNNLKRRFVEHNNGESPSTKPRSPFKLIHYEAFVSEKDAFETEKYLKTTRGWERIHRMLENTLKNNL